MTLYRLILKKNFNHAVLVLPSKWLMLKLIVPFLINKPYYLIEDSMGNLVQECAISIAV